MEEELIALINQAIEKAKELHPSKASLVKAKLGCIIGLIKINSQPGGAVVSPCKGCGPRAKLIN